jgi:hypothetical protein
MKEIGELKSGSALVPFWRQKKIGKLIKNGPLFRDRKKNWKTKKWLTTSHFFETEEKLESEIIFKKNWKTEQKEIGKDPGQISGSIPGSSS